MQSIQSLYRIIFLLLILAAGCEKYDDHPEFPSSDLIADGDYLGEYWPTEKWRECSPKEVGMDPKMLKELNEEILMLQELHFDIHNLLIIKDGYIVAEQYYSEDYGPESLHRIYSCTKSFTSALLGIAIEQGYDLDLSDKMVDLFPEYEIENLSDYKEQITVEHLLTMSDGLEWYELDYLYSDDRNTFRQWIDQGGGVEFVINQPSLAPPGETYSYNTGVSHVLSAIVQKATGMRSDSFALDNLFTPIGIDDYYWPIDGNGVAYGGSAMRLTPRDMARFGYLYLKKGEWEGTQIVPENWVEASQHKHIKRKYISDSHYGYHWWVMDAFYAAVGFGGQWIMVIPDHNLVVVFNNYFEEGAPNQWETPERLLETFILPAIEK